MRWFADSDTDTYSNAHPYSNTDTYSNAHPYSNTDTYADPNAIPG
ncbi:hypothetical protein GCM10007862_09330 [Dyella lipolytica]|nr:hypothetical protein GCM10007862_09330 [Dyella lipolytica]